MYLKKRRKGQMCKNDNKKGIEIPPEYVVYSSEENTAKQNIFAKLLYISKCYITYNLLYITYYIQKKY